MSRRRLPGWAMVGAAGVLIATCGACGRNEQTGASNATAPTGVANGSRGMQQDRSFRSPAEALFVEKCSMCHREMGMGTVLLARRMNPSLADKDRFLAALDQAEAASGPIDGLFANAGTGGRFSPIADYSDEDFDAVIAVNLGSVFRAMKRILPGMIARRRGAILVTGSLASERGMANNAAYVASKHGVLGLARAAALEAAPHNVRVNCIIPGFIETPMLADLGPDARAMLAAAVPQGRVGSADELAQVAAFLLSDAASHVTGQSWAVDGGVLGTLKLG
jgi:NAD(P)-dependent dehydrogenase (short-subunit alcohol dehydrogenase family)